ncbi:unnamed protein product [Porites lobata]|uniref:Uncharacterized protein n=1 Tax=Porites lobata TaxID=104759 RepID=A0ABN8PTQ6_9CNID|nr:unnamed protein product [Porites lobata]
MNKQEQLIANGQEFTVLLAELGFHYSRICTKAGNSAEALAVFDKLLKTAGIENHCKNGHFKLQIPPQVCCCVCLVCKAAILLNSTIKSQTQESLQQMLFESNRLISQILRCSTLPSPMLKLLSDSLEYFRINLQNESNKKSKEKSPTLSFKTLQGTVQVLQSYISVLSLQCERLKSELLKSKHDNIVAQLKQQVLKTTERQMTVFSFVISSYQEQLKNEKDAKTTIRDSRSIFKDCIPVVEQANSVIHSALDDPDIPLSSNELRWLGCNVYNLGCVSYQRDCFTEGVPLLAIACE